MKEYTDAGATIAVDGKWTVVPFAESYLLTNSKGATENGKPSKNRLYQITVTDGKITALTQLVFATGFQSLFTQSGKTYSVSKLTARAGGGFTLDIACAESSGYDGLTLPAESS